MAKQLRRLRVLDSGSLEILDPCYDEDLALLQDIDPSFAILEAALPGFAGPRFLRIRECGVMLPVALALVDDRQLWSIHDSAMAGEVLRGTESATLLDVKIELANRTLRRCSLCAHRCGVDRTQAQFGKCRLGIGARVVEHFVHIGEEPPINPSLVLSLEGCGLRCRYCQQWQLLNPGSLPAEALDSSLWLNINVAHARSLTFVGGNPDESLPSILAFLRDAPAGWALPIVWNNHGYCTPESLALLNGVVDAYVPDFKYGNDECARVLSGAPGYVGVALDSIARMLRQDVPVYVRILVLPGHVDCCHLPVVGMLASIRVPHLFVSLRGQYAPDYRVKEGNGRHAASRYLARRPEFNEIERVHDNLMQRGLQTVESATPHDSVYERQPQDPRRKMP